MLMYAFVHVPKTGGKFMKKYLRPPLNFDLCPESNLAPHQPVSWYESHNHDHIFMTMVREPYDRAVSEYFYMKRLNEERNPSQLKIKAEDITDKYLEFYSFMFGSVYSTYYNSKEIEDFDFVGNMHDMERSIKLANAMFDLGIVNEHINVNPYHTINQPYDGGYSRSEFKEKNAKDYEIFYRGIEKFNSLCNEYGISGG